MKEKLFAEVPALEAYKDGHDVYLTLKKDVGPVMSAASTYSDTIILAKAAKILHRHI